MRSLIKTLLWGLAALALIFVAVPYGVGWLLASRFDQAVAQLSIPGYLQVAQQDFDRGWFVSHARIALRPVGPLCHASPCPVITLVSRIDHGPLARGAERAPLVPVLAVVHSRADLTSLWPGYVFSPAPDPLIVISRIGLDGHAQARLTLRGTSFDVARQLPIAHVETAAVSAELQSNLLAHRVGGLRLDWSSFSLLRQSGGHLGWRNVRFQARSADDGALSDMRFSADSVTLDNGAGRATRLTDVKLTTRRPAPSTTTFSLNINQLVLPDNTQGAFILDARQHGMDPGAWAALPGRWNELGGRSGGALNAPELYHNIVPDLLPPGSRLQIKRFELDTRDGAIRAQAQIHTPQDFQPPNTAVALLSQLQARVQLSLPRPILRRLVARTVPPAEAGRPDAAIDARIGKLVTRGLITPADDGKNYRLRMVLSEGRMKINGRKRPEWRILVDQFQAAAQGL